MTTTENIYDAIIETAKRESHTLYELHSAEFGKKISARVETYKSILSGIRKRMTICENNDEEMKTSEVLSIINGIQSCTARDSDEDKACSNVLGIFHSEIGKL